MAIQMQVDRVTPGDRVFAYIGQSNDMQIANVADMPGGDAALATPLAAVRYAGRTFASAVDVTPTDWGWIDLGPTNSGTKHGSELGFGNALGAGNSIIKYCIGGTSLSTWESENRAANAIAWIQSKLATYDGGAYHLSGIIWCQGESDNTTVLATAWKARYQAIIAAFRTAFGRTRLPVVLIQTSKDIVGTGVALLRAEQAAAAATDSWTTLINTDAYALGGDGLHWASPEITDIGQAAAVAVAGWL